MNYYEEGEHGPQSPRRLTPPSQSPPPRYRSRRHLQGFPRRIPPVFVYYRNSNVTLWQHVLDVIGAPSILRLTRKFARLACTLFHVFHLNMITTSGYLEIDYINF